MQTSTIGIALIKSSEALAYEKNAAMQIPSSALLMLEGKLRITVRAFYASERPDLDCSVLFDVLQPRYAKLCGKRVMARRGVICNDRQLREQHLYHGVDKNNPRAEIEIETLEPKAELF